jgi:hypothetical protein
MYTPYDQGIMDERQRCCRVLCNLCRAADASGRLSNGSLVSKTRQRGNDFYHQVSALQGNGATEAPCAAAKLLASG